jgi:hypothetical protein
MPPAGFEHIVPVREWPKTGDLRRRPLGSAVPSKNRDKLPLKELCLIGNGAACITRHEGR